MRGILIQAASTEAEQTLLAITRAHHRWYAERHGLEFLSVASNPAAPRQAAWAKVSLMMTAMQMHFTHIVWLDPAALIYDAQVNLATLIDRGLGMARQRESGPWTTSLVVMTTRHETANLLMRMNQTADVAEADERGVLTGLLETPEFAGLATRLAPSYLCPTEDIATANPIVRIGDGLPLPRRCELLRGWLAQTPINEEAPGASLSPEVMRRQDWGPFLNRRGLIGEAAEVGVQRGNFSRALLDSWQGRMLHLVDPWQNFGAGYVDIANVSQMQHEANLQYAQRQLEPHVQRFQIHRQTSVEAATRFADGALDFVYIDANHEFSAVLADLHAWFPKIRPGGVIAGDD